MLQSIAMRNIALIEELTLDFSNGLHVLTGETGAGKSIVVDAVNLVLGGRIDKSLIRTGTSKAFVEAVFDIHALFDLKPLLLEQGIEPEEEQLIISREINESGKSVARICGMAVQVAFLRQITAFLMDVHGQHEHQYLMDPKKHLGFLDISGDAGHTALLKTLRDAYDDFITLHRTYAGMVREDKQRAQKIEILKFQLAELNEARLKPGEDEALNQESALLKHSQRIGTGINEAYGALMEMSASGDSTLSMVRKAFDALSSISELDAGYAALCEKLGSLYYELEDVSHTLSMWQDEMDFDPKRSEKIDERLDLIKRLCKKYKPSVDEMLAFRQELENELAQYENYEDTLEKLKDTHRKLLKQYRAAAREVTASRKRLADTFEKRMMAELKDLGMAQTVFSVSFKEPAPDEKPAMPTALGDDTVEFLISPNPGEPLKPLAKIASGGEMSRIMLAMKAISAQTGGVPCMVFDEIDTGISGKMAQIVAEKMSRIARFKQVICVTHLPQIAAMADHQYLVEKRVAGQRTSTSVNLLSEDQRALEIARMVSGAAGEEQSAVQHAQAMLGAAAVYRVKLN